MIEIEKDGASGGLPDPEVSPAPRSESTVKSASQGQLEELTPRPKRKRATSHLKKVLSLRDGLYTWLFGPAGPMHLVRCSECARFIPGGTSTVGHRVALAIGGTNDLGNLRIECEECNFTDGRRYNERPTDTSRVCMERRRAKKNEGRRKRMAALEAVRPRVIFDNFPVFWDGRLISYTSRRRAQIFIERGTGRALNGTGVELLRPPSGDNPDGRLIPNECVRCRTTRDLTCFRIYPPGHPALDRTIHFSDVTRPVCEKCRFLFEIGYGAEITRATLPVIFSCLDRLSPMIDRQIQAAEAWSRVKTGAPIGGDLVLRMKRLFNVDPSEADVRELRAIMRTVQYETLTFRRVLRREIIRAAAEAGVKFPALFERLRAFEDGPEEIPLPEVPSLELRRRARFL